MRLTTAAKAVRYRVEQFLRALTARHAISEQQVKRAAEILSPEARALLVQQAPHDQRHALAVYETLLQEGHTNRDLLAAALLHDVGKAAAPAPPWQRGIFVLAERLAPSTLSGVMPSASYEKGDGKRSHAIYARHAEIGARWAEKAGCSALTVELIRHHEHSLGPCRTERDRLMVALQAADNVN